MFKHLGHALFYLLMGIAAIQTDKVYSQTPSVRDSVLYSSNQRASSVQLVTLNNSSSIEPFDSVHVWPESECGLCHLAEDPFGEPMLFVESDQSMLCESCHPGKITLLPDTGLSMETHALNNHPIKFSPFDFDSERINHTIIKKDGTFYLSSSKGELPLFGDSEETAVAECSTCHDPHGTTTVPMLGRFDNRGGELCIVCHININMRKTFPYY